MVATTTTSAAPFCSVTSFKYTSKTPHQSFGIGRPSVHATLRSFLDLPSTGTNPLKQFPHLYHSQDSETRCWLQLSLTVQEAKKSYDSNKALEMMLTHGLLTFVMDVLCDYSAQVIVTPCDRHVNDPMNPVSVSLPCLFSVSICIPDVRLFQRVFGGHTHRPAQTRSSKFYQPNPPLVCCGSHLSYSLELVILSKKGF